MSSLFEAVERGHFNAARPLASRMRPRSLDEFAGQEHFLGPGKLLRRMIDSQQISSIVFYGPPGTGKTTLAHLVASTIRAEFVAINAAASSVKELREIQVAAHDRLASSNRRTILFVDELHRFNRAQQDVLLGDVEEGIITLIAATTQNPFFAINTPLLSRSQIFEFNPLSRESIKLIMTRALVDRERGLGMYQVELTAEAADFLSDVCDGDARRALNAIEVGVRSSKSEPIQFDLALAQDCIQRKIQGFDPSGDAHYDLASAFIKSMRGSDPDAAIYWMARMLESGEDARFVARRVVICAAEDVGNADPLALIVANAAFQISEFVGMPECKLPLAQAVTYISCAPKSNASTVAISEASKDVREGRTFSVPTHLRDKSYEGADQLGHGDGYVYTHDSTEGWVDQVYLPVDREYYRPVDRGVEREILRRLTEIRKRRSNSQRVEGTKS